MTYRSRLAYNPALGHQAPLSADPPLSTGLDDDFITEGPMYAQSGIIQPGFVALDPKWQLYDPHGSFDFAAIDTRLQMAYLQCDTPKAWAGFYQLLPQPTLQNPVREHWLMTRMLVASVGGGAQMGFEGGLWGLLLSEDLATDPFNATLRCIGGMVNGGDGGGFRVCQTFPVAGTFLANDGPMILEGAGEDGIVSVSTFYRARIRQERVSESPEATPTWRATVIAECGTMGADWFPLCAWEITGAAVPPCKHVGFGARTPNGVELAAYCDFFRCIECPTSEYLTIGTVPRIGA